MTEPPGEPTFKPMNRSRASGMSGNVTLELVNRIGSDIVSGRVQPGTILPNETVLTETFDVSRTAIREAVKMLTARGLVETRPRRGTTVRPVRDWNLLDGAVLSWVRQMPPEGSIIIELLELRLGFEPEAAALAARKGTVAQHASILSAYEMMDASTTGKFDPVEADCAFHEAILAATNNRFYQPLGSLIHTALSLTAPVTNALFGHNVGDLERHSAVEKAISARDDVLAHNLMRQMLGGVVEAVAGAEKLPRP